MKYPGLKFLILLLSVMSLGAQNDVPQLKIPKVKDLIKVEKPKVIRIQFEIYHLPSDSTFFWDKSLINLKRRNPMGDGILSAEKAEIFRKVITEQQGKRLMSSRLSMVPTHKATMGMQNRQNYFYLKVSDGSLKEDTFTSNMEFGIRDNSSPPVDINQKSKMDCPWTGDIPIGSTLYLVSRSKDLKIQDNYIALLTPSLP